MGFKLLVKVIRKLLFQLNSKVRGERFTVNPHIGEEENMYSVRAW